MAQADKMRAKATKAAAAQNMLRRADGCSAGAGPSVRAATRSPKLRFPDPAPCGRTPLTAERAVQVLRLAGGLHRRRPGHRPGQPGGGARAQRRRQNHPAAAARRRSRRPTPAQVRARPRPAAGLLRPGARDPGHRTHRAGEHPHAAPDAARQQLRTLLGAFLFSGEQLDQLAGVLSGGEKTRLALAVLVSSAANVLLLDEPTNNLDPASREQVLDALRHYAGAVVLVTHDPGRSQALHPERVILLPDGTEDHWSEDYLDLVQLA